MRHALSVSLAGALPDWDIVPEMVAPEHDLVRPRLMIGTKSITPGTMGGLVRVECKAYLLAAPVTAEAWEDSLDTALAELLLALQTVRGATWTSAERVTIDDDWPGWSIDLAGTIRIGE